MKFEQKCVNRLKNMLKQDKERLSEPLLNMIKSDVYIAINNYFDVKIDDVNLKYFINNDGAYVLNINFLCNRVKKITFFNK